MFKNSDGRNSNPNLFNIVGYIKHGCSFFRFLLPKSISMSSDHILLQGLPNHIPSAMIQNILCKDPKTLRTFWDFHHFVY